MNLILFSNETKSDDLRILDFVSYLRPDFVDKAIRIAFDSGGQLKHVRLQSNNFGIANWINGKGFTDCHSWEKEDDAQSVSNLSKHYTTILLNGPVDSIIAKDKILPDIASSTYSSEMLSIISEIHQHSSSSLKFNIEKLIEETK